MSPVSVPALLVDLLRILSYTLTSPRSRILLLPPIVALCIWDVIPLNRPGKTQDELHSQIGQGSLAASRLLGAIQCIILMYVQKDLHRKKDVKSHISISDAGFLERLKWGIELFISPRGVGWTHEPTSHLRWIPSHSSASRFTFILRQVVRVAKFAMVGELMKLLLVLNPCIGRPARDVSWLWRFSFLQYMIGVAYAGMSQAQVILSILLVGIGISNPRDWSTLNGSWKDAYTVRRFWGRTWHQLFRHMFQTYSKFVSRSLFGLSPGTLASRYTDLYCAFAISGVLHAAGDYKLLGNLQESASLQFFILQALAITVEDVVKWGGDRLGVRWGTRWLRYSGYVWVTLWFTWSLPMWMEPMARTIAPENSLLLGLYIYLKEVIVALIK